MRTTIDLPDDIHHIARAIALDSDRTLSEAVTMLIRRGLGEKGSYVIKHDSETGLQVVSLGYPVTSADVAAVDDE